MSEGTVSGIRCCIFDKDGTLVQTGSLFDEWFMSLSRKIIMHMNWTEDTVAQELYYRKMGWNVNAHGFLFDSIVARGTYPQIKAALLQFMLTEQINVENKTEDTIEKEIESNMWVHPTLDTSDLHPCGDIDKLFDFLAAKNIKIAICTSDDRHLTQQCIEFLNLTNKVHTMVCADDEGVQSKPSGEPIEKICKELNILPQDCIMIGDSSGDMQAGRAAKCKMVIGVLSSGATKTDFDADMVIPNIDSLIDIIV